jgi:hypothetical protein
MGEETAKQRLERLLRALKLGAVGRVPARKRLQAKNLAWRMPLSHATSAKNFGTVLGCGHLRSLHNLIKAKVVSPRPEASEYQLGTENSVFLFVGPFCFPNQTCGFLWRADLEKDVTGEASPFDSGGLHKVFTRESDTESAREFLARHCLALWEHRDYLEAKLSCLFPNPRYYIDCQQVDTEIQDPAISLHGGDRRRWTHEVRVVGKLPLTAELLAVFVPTSVKRKNRSILHGWQEAEITVIGYRSRDGDFSMMQKACQRFIRLHMKVAK